MTVVSEAFVPKPGDSSRIPTAFERPNERGAVTQDDFINLVREVLQSGHVKAIIQSLIARTNEVRELTPPIAEGNPGGQATATDAGAGLGK